jgi:hypothetical protein
MKAQTLSLDEYTSGIQTGFLDVWFYNEKRLTNEIALRSEVGLEHSVSGDPFFKNSSLFIAPVFTVEPRWYFNLARRANKGKTTIGNSGDFIALKASYYPYWHVVSGQSRIRVASLFSLIPTWGFKRNIGRHFTYEAGIGFGDRYTFFRNLSFSEIDVNLGVNLHLRVGYRF